MKKLAGVYTDTKKDGTPNYRAGITYHGKHISLGSYETMQMASKAYEYAKKLLENEKITVNKYRETCPLNFEKFVVLINLRDNNMYLSTPIILSKKFFYYYLSQNDVCKFDLDDLFYFSSHKIMRRGNHLFVADYGMQVSVNERFGIRGFAVEGRDYKFLNGDILDYRRENIEIINSYFGVRRETRKGKTAYKAVIHIKSDFVVGHYLTETTAAIAYNKAADTLRKNGVNKKFPQNYIEGISQKDYADLYTSIVISEKITDYKPT